jgi:hypothetical protein
MIATKQLRIALYQYIESLGFPTTGIEFPRVEVASLQMSNGNEKSGLSFVVNCTLDCITQSDSPLQSYEVVDRVRESIEQVATLISGFDINLIVLGDMNEIIEDTDSGVITRQEQQVNFNLTKKII